MFRERPLPGVSLTNRDGDGAARAQVLPRQGVTLTFAELLVCPPTVTVSGKSPCGQPGRHHDIRLPETDEARSKSGEGHCGRFALRWWRSPRKSLWKDWTGTGRCAIGRLIAHGARAGEIGDDCAARFGRIAGAS